MKLIVDKAIPFIEGVFEPYLEVQYVDSASIDADTVRDADALAIRTRTRCNADLLEGSKAE